MKPSSLWREPLVHFLLLGAVLFVAYGVLAPESDEDRLIDVTEADIELLVERYKKQLGVEPTQKELGHLIDNHIRNEILYLEARRMQLDDKDTIVKRRLVQKLEFLIQDMVVPEAPGDEVLQDYFDKHVEDYRVSAIASFDQLYFSPDKRSDALADATALIEQLQAGEIDHEKARQASDRSPVGSVMQGQNMLRLNRQLGRVFVEQLQQLDSASRDWQGPIESGYGIHLVKLNDWVESSLPVFEDVKPQVERDWLRQAREDANEDYYQTLKAQYQVSVAGDGDAS
ncbi:peptidyl-prolyl cis-trans isomerase [Maricurvus nonylphenolicus]|uniref:peptidylprolyl isomerase n=1 Tax=Maricurvus nonylphenolicus TaxID=1008307 RepID=UPI0036F29F6A